MFIESNLGCCLLELNHFLKGHEKCVCKLKKPFTVMGICGNSYREQPMIHSSYFDYHEKFFFQKTVAKN